MGRVTFLNNRTFFRIPAGHETHTGKIPDDRPIGYRRDTVAKILKIVHFGGGKWTILNRLKVLLNPYLSLILVLLESYVLKILIIGYFLCVFFFSAKMVDI